MKARSFSGMLARPGSAAHAPFQRLIRRFLQLVPRCQAADQSLPVRFRVAGLCRPSLFSALPGVLQGSALQSSFVGQKSRSLPPALRSAQIIRIPLAPHRARTQRPAINPAQTEAPAAAQRGRAQLASYPHRHPNRVCAPSVSLAASVGTNISIRKADIVSGVEMMSAFSFCALLSDIPPAMSECVYPECCYSLWNIIMLSGISSFIAEYCYSLRNILIPDGISSCSSEYPYSRKNILILPGIELFAIRISIFLYE